MFSRSLAITASETSRVTAKKEAYIYALARLSATNEIESGVKLDLRRSPRETPRRGNVGQTLSTDRSVERRRN